MNFQDTTIKKNIPLAPLTTFKIGGTAKYFIETDNKDELIIALNWAKIKSLPVFILGGGSNVLVSDKGFDGLVIKNNLTGLRVIDNTIIADSGIAMSEVVLKSTKHNLTGFEWAIGIPGTFGGSIRGNAGCFGGEIKDTIGQVSALDANSIKEITFNPKDCKFGYRDSIFKHMPNLIIISAEISLQKGDVDISRDIIQGYAKSRIEQQDIGVKCAGCVFKNVLWKRKDIRKDTIIKKFPELEQFENSPYIPAGFLIDFLGLKGMEFNDIIISNKHANYIVNLNNAKAKDVIKVINFIKEKILKHYGILLEEEIQKIN